MRVITLAAWLCLMSAHAIAIRIPLPDILKDLVEEADTRQQSSTATLSVISSTAFLAWKNGNRHPVWGVAEIQKRSPPTTGRHAAAVLSNKGVPQFWEM